MYDQLVSEPDLFETHRYHNWYLVSRFDVSHYELDKHQFCATTRKCTMTEVVKHFTIFIVSFLIPRRQRIVDKEIGDF
jgi:hypothetical protein